MVFTANTYMEGGDKLETIKRKNNFRMVRRSIAGLVTILGAWILMATPVYAVTDDVTDEPTLLK